MLTPLLKTSKINSIVRNSTRVEIAYIYIYATTRHGVTRIQEKEVQNIAAYRKSV